MQWMLGSGQIWWKTGKGWQHSYIEWTRWAGHSKTQFFSILDEAFSLDGVSIKELNAMDWRPIDLRADWKSVAKSEKLYSTTKCRLQGSECSKVKAAVIGGISRSFTSSVTCPALKATSSNSPEILVQIVGTPVVLVCRSYLWVDGQRYRPSV